MKRNKEHRSFLASNKFEGNNFNNISLSKLSNIDMTNISYSDLLRSGNINDIEDNFDNRFKTAQVKQQFQNIVDNIEQQNLIKNRLKQQLYNKIFSICLNDMKNNYKTNKFIIFEIPLNYMDINYNWRECRKYLIKMLKLQSDKLILKYNKNYLYIDWSKMLNNFDDILNE